MEIIKIRDGNRLTIGLSGRLDSNTSPKFEAELGASLEGITELVLDFDQLNYLSSAGLRVILGCQKQMNKRGKMTIIHVNDIIMEIFTVTGFTEILTIE